MHGLLHVINHDACAYFIHKVILFIYFILKKDNIADYPKGEIPYMGEESHELSSKRGNISLLCPNETFSSYEVLFTLYILPKL